MEEIDSKSWVDESVVEPSEQKVVKQRLPWLSSEKGSIFILCAVAFLINCQPSEPFLVQYLTENKGLSEEQLDNEVWPYDTYGSFLFLIPVGLLAEIYGYRRVVFFGFLCREATRVLLIFARGVALMAVMQVTYAAATCANTVYFAYAYMVVDKSDFEAATSYMRFSYHAGNLIGAIIGQLLVDNGNSLTTLFYLSWMFTTLGLICFLIFLPKPTRAAPPSLAGLLLSTGRNRRLLQPGGSIAQDSKTDSQRPGRNSATDLNSQTGWKDAWKEIRLLYTGSRLLKWCFFWSIMYGVTLMISNYYQNQVYNINPDAKFGYLEAAAEGFAALGALAALLSKNIGERWTAPLIFVGTAVMGICYILTTREDSSLFDVSVLNVIPMGIFGYLFSLASSQIALDALTPRYAISFTLNTFASLFLAVIVQQAAAGTKTSTNGYYVIAAIETFFVALTALVMIAVPSMR
eukprot:CAMPEP_0167743474 /NCGR_PEP_ID=MMETSP0110_2-20121227/2035_1 /TAXON_ID=629695 /ORGANISM="Gymnochlora sp., Strain CCMP2014" /LENGTH=461 /DNA_ID=CAMNT_0007627847 /DNA_START=75 /DNA_END=1460 /DNA_ORIENTATION=-